MLPAALRGCMVGRTRTEESALGVVVGLFLAVCLSKYRGPSGTRSGTEYRHHNLSHRITLPNNQINPPALFFVVVVGGTFLPPPPLDMCLLECRTGRNKT